MVKIYYLTWKIFLEINKKNIYKLQQKIFIHSDSEKKLG